MFLFKWSKKLGKGVTVFFFFDTENYCSSEHSGPKKLIWSITFNTARVMKSIYGICQSKNNLTPSLFPCVE